MLGKQSQQFTLCKHLSTKSNERFSIVLLQLFYLCSNFNNNVSKETLKIMKDVRPDFPALLWNIDHVTSVLPRGEFHSVSLYQQMSLWIEASYHSYKSWGEQAFTERFYGTETSLPFCRGYRALHCPCVTALLTGTVPKLLVFFYSFAKVFGK